MLEIAHRSDGLHNYELHRQRASLERGCYLRGSSSSSLPSVSPQTKRRVSLFVTALAVATGAFWATMLTSPPVTEAADPGFSILELHRNAPLSLPITEADAI
jgi:hypothetical protein